jgi:hypothetical protein
LAPFNLCSVVLAYIAAVVIDATGNYRLIWLFPAATGLAHATVNCWLKYPARSASGPDMVGRLWEWSVVQAESMAETGIVTGLLAAPLLGVVTKEDADSAVVIDMARNILGNPYEDVPGPPSVEAGSDDAPAGPSGPARSDPADGGGVTGVLQVGGGPLDGRPMGDEKSGRGVSSETPGGPGGGTGTGPVLNEGAGGTDGDPSGPADTSGGPPADDAGGNPDPSSSP